MQKRFTSRGYSILAALVFVAILSSIALGVKLISPSTSGPAMVAAGAAPSTQATPAKKDPVKLEGASRCNAPIEAKRGPQEGRAGVDTICVKGCTYRVHGGGGADTRVEATDRCAAPGLSTNRKNSCMAMEVCRVEVCDKDGACSLMTSGNPVETLGRAAGVPDYFKNDKEITDALEKAKKGEDPYADLNKYPSWYKDAFEEVKQQELTKINDQKASAIQDIDRLSQGVQDGTAFSSDLEKAKARLGDLEQQQKNLSNVSALGSDVSSIGKQASNGGWDEKGFVDAFKQSSCKSSACADGEIARNNPNTFTKTPIPQVDPRKVTPGPGVQGPGPGQSGGLGGLGGSGLGLLGSFLQGFAKGFAGGGSQGPACSSDPNAYQQQQQQYQMQMQQYNYQLQQYNYQQQQAYNWGGVVPQPPQPPVACTPTGDSNTCPATPPQPTTGCSDGTWKPVTTQQSNGRQCTTSWQCAPGTATPPSAEMSCQPKIADVGMSVAISFTCTNATGSTGAGQGFETNNETSGSRSVTIENPPAGATGVNFGLTCRNQNLTAKAECSVQIARPTIILLANPKHVASGESSRVGWVTSGMQSCVVSSPQMPGFTTQNANNTSVNGTATTSPLTRDTTVVLTCQTIGGNTKAASTTITVGDSATSSAMTVTSTIDSKTDVKHGSSATVTWEAPSAPSNSAVALWLVDMQSGQATGLIARDKETSGNYAWTLPATSTPCAADSPYICGADLVAGRSYSIQASLYTPPNAYLGGYPPANPISPTYLDEDTTPAFKMAD